MLREFIKMELILERHDEPLQGQTANTKLRNIFIA